MPVTGPMERAAGTPRSPAFTPVRWGLAVLAGGAGLLTAFSCVLVAHLEGETTTVEAIVVGVVSALAVGMCLGFSLRDPSWKRFFARFVALGAFPGMLLVYVASGGNPSVLEVLVGTFAGALIGLFYAGLCAMPFRALREVHDRPTRTSGLSVWLRVSLSLSVLSVCVLLGAWLTSNAAWAGLATCPSLALAAGLWRSRAVRRMGRGLEPGFERVSADTLAVPPDLLPLHAGVSVEPSMVLVETVRTSSGPFREVVTRVPYAWVD